MTNKNISASTKMRKSFWLTQYLGDVQDESSEFFIFLGLEDEEDDFVGDDDGGDDDADEVVVEYGEDDGEYEQCLVRCVLSSRCR